MTTLGDQIIADNISNCIKSIIGAAIVVAAEIEKNPNLAEKEFEQLKNYISTKLKELN